ncbi:MAG: glycosyltransferase [Dysgonomonas sp.]|nr:glycosyltransferase [Dysgonomonas sp.]
MSESNSFIMNEENFNISLLVGLKNNLEYSINFYETTRKLYPNVEIVFVSYGSTDGTHQWLDSLNDSNLIYYYFPETKTFSDTYNKCSELATKDYIVFLHNDMVLTPHFLENIVKYLDKDTIVGFSTIEPPIFSKNERIGKIVKDFGIDIQNLELDELYRFSIDYQQRYKNQIANKIDLLFFIALCNEKFKSVNGLDNLFDPMFCEDDDLFLRLEAIGLNKLTSLDAICYHFVSKTSRFSEDVIKKTKEIECNSQRNFLRKWGFPSYNDKRKVYDIGIVLKNATLDTIQEIEPYASQLYVDCDFSEYIKKEQPKTKLDLSRRILPIKSFNKEHDILIIIDENEMDEKSFFLVKNVYQKIEKRRKESFKNLFRSKNKIKKKGVSVVIQNYN